LTPSTNSNTSALRLFRYFASGVGDLRRHLMARGCSSKSGASDRTEAGRHGGKNAWRTSQSRNIRVRERRLQTLLLGRCSPALAAECWRWWDSTASISLFGLAEDSGNRIRMALGDSGEILKMVVYSGDACWSASASLLGAAGACIVFLST